MSEKNIDAVKEQSFNQISDILMSIEAPGVDPLEKTAHILDVVEQLLARVLSGSSLNSETLDEICEESFANVKKMAKRFLHEENAKK
jgi:hypothetical protein